MMKILLLVLSLALAVDVRGALDEGEVCFTGFIMDTYCILRGKLLDNNKLDTLKFPHEHSIHCLVDVGWCVGSGYEVLTAPENGGDEYVRAVKLDSFGNSECLDRARTVGTKCSTCYGKGSQEKGFAATVTGYIEPDSGSPPMLRTTAVMSDSVTCKSLEATTGIDICFSGETTVDVKQKGLIRMSELAIGDLVRVNGSEFTRVYGFGHYDPKRTFDYLQLYYHEGEAPLEISSDHLVFVLDTKSNKNSAIPASTIKVGDMLLLDGTQAAPVLQIKSIKRTGAYAPFTESGTLLVNRVLASSYVTLQPNASELRLFGISTGLTMHWLAHIGTSPRRWYCSYWNCDGEVYGKDGIATWVPYHISQYFIDHLVQALLLMIASLTILKFCKRFAIILGPSISGVTSESKKLL